MIKIFVDTKEIDVQVTTFPAGEPSLKLEPCSGTVAVIQCFFDTCDDLILALMAEDILRNVYDIPSIRINLPYMPFSREDRRTVHNGSFGLKILAKLLEPFDAVTTIDMHSERGSKWFKTFLDIPVQPYITQAINDSECDVVVLPDKGAADKYTPLIQDKDIICGSKVRDPETGWITKYELPEYDFDKKKVLVVDDICDGGATFIKLAEAMKEREGWALLNLYVTHGIFSKGLERLKEHYHHIYTTETIYKGESNEFITIY